MTGRVRWIGAIAGLAILAAAVVWARWGAAEAPPESRPATQPARRIIAMAPSTVEIIFELAAGDRLVGVSPYCTYPPQVARVPRIGGLHDPDLEQIVALNPDLLITRGTSEALKRLCHEHDIRVYEDPSDTLASIYRAIHEIGDLLGRPQEAAELADRVRTELENVRRRVGQREPVPMLLSIRRPDKIAKVYTVGRGAYLNDLIEIAGGRNVFDDLAAAWPVVGPEEVVAKAPEVIVEAMPGLNVDRSVLASVIEQWRALGPIPAVVDGRVYVITDDYALAPSPRVTEMARRLAQCLHPEVSFDE